MRYRIFSIFALLMLVVAIGCSGGTDPVQSEPEKIVSSNTIAHENWGLWQFSADPVKETLDVIQLRSGQMHLNAMPFLEPPALLNLTLETVEFNGNIIETDIGLRHPFLGLTEFSGFDVCGILISNGSVSGFEDPNLVMAGDGDTYLMNADGWSRWWNPSEFPQNGTMFGYQDGLLGAPDSYANYNCTLNGYKLYSDDLDIPTDPLDALIPSTRLTFTAGQKNVRHYTIQTGNDGLIFNYAIDANWQFPNGNPPWNLPDDFPEEANRPEAWHITTTVLDNSLWNDGLDNGGNLSFEIDVWDHFNADLNTVKIESAGNFPTASTSTAISGGEGYSTYQIDIVDATPAEGSIEVFITVESEMMGYGGILPGEPVSSYFFAYFDVSPDPPVAVECDIGIHTTATKTPWTDQSSSQVKYELAWLKTGPYQGEMLVQSAPATLRRYDVDNIAPPTGSVFLTLPAGTWSGIGLIYHIEVEPVTGRVICVPNGLGDNNSLLIFDDQGNLISQPSGLSSGAGRKIMAIHSNNNGDLWLLTTTPVTWDFSQNSKLELWEYQSDAPYYVHNPAFDLDTDEFLGVDDPYFGVGVPNNVVDMVISHEKQRLFIFQQAEVGEHNGWLNVFDLSDSAPPTHNAGLSTTSLFSLPTWRGFNGNQKNAYGGIWIDHTEEAYDQCRILVYGRSNPYQYTMLIKLDADMNVLDEVTVPGVTSPYTMGINPDPDVTLRNIVFVNYPSDQCFIGQAPSGW